MCKVFQWKKGNGKRTETQVREVTEVNKWCCSDLLRTNLYKFHLTVLSKWTADLTCF